jgi:hypothetical protein
MSTIAAWRRDPGSKQDKEYCSCGGGDTSEPAQRWTSIYPAYIPNIKFGSFVTGIALYTRIKLYHRFAITDSMPMAGEIAGEGQEECECVEAKWPYQRKRRLVLHHPLSAHGEAQLYCASTIPVPDVSYSVVALLFPLNLLRGQQRDRLVACSFASTMLSL